MNRTEYIRLHSDYTARKEWLKAHIEGTDVPPVTFEIDGADSRGFAWEKKVGKVNTVTDYAETELPVKRSWYMIEYTDRTHGIGVELKVTSYPEYPVVEYEGYLVNLGGKNSPEIKNVKSLDTDVTQTDAATVHYNYGSRYCQEEFRPLSKEMRQGDTLGFETTAGRPTMEYLPLMNIEDKKKGTGVLSVLGWAGRWRKDIMFEDGKVKVTDGELATDFVLLPRERFRTPICILMFYRGGYIDGQNLWRRWMYEHNILRYSGRRQNKPTVCVCIGDWYPGMMGNAADDILNAKKIKETGLNEYIDEFVQDAGWYYCGGQAEGWPYHGNWYPDPVRYPDGLGPVGDALHEAGLKYRVWFESENLLGETSTVRELGDRVIAFGKDENGQLYKRSSGEDIKGQMIAADLTDPDTVEFTAGWINRQIDEGHIDTYRQDHFGIGQFWDPNDECVSRELGVPRRGITEEKFTAGYHGVWKRIVEKHPGMMIDSCAAGGMRNDIETMRYSYAYTRTDWWSNLEDSQCHNIGAAAWLVNMGGASPDSAWPVRVEGDFDPYQYRTEMVTMLGTAINFINDIPAEKIEKIKDMLSKWKDLAQYAYFDFYPLVEVNYRLDCVLANQYDSPEQGKGVVLIYERPEAECEYTVYPTHLVPDAEYTVKDMDSGEEFCVLGREFMEKGISGEAKKTRHSREYRYYIK